MGYTIERNWSSQGWNAPGSTHTLQVGDTIDLSGSVSVTKAGDATPVFSDGFENDGSTKSISVTSSVFSSSMTVGADQNGYGWQDAVNAKIEVGGGRVSGDALLLRHPAQADGDDSTAQIDFVFGADLDEVWVEYWMMLPTNYFHRDSTGTDNNKFFQVWSGPRSSQNVAAVFETQKSIDGQAGESKVHLVITNQDPDDVATWDFPDDPHFTLSEQGVWIRLRWHLKVGTAQDIQADAYDGVAEVWEDSTQIFGPGPYERKNGEFEDGVNLYALNDVDNFFDQLRILGACNSGYDNDTDFLFDDFKVYDTDPGW